MIYVYISFLLKQLLDILYTHSLKYLHTRVDKFRANECILRVGSGRSHQIVEMPNVRWWSIIKFSFEFAKCLLSFKSCIQLFIAISHESILAQIT